MSLGSRLRYSRKRKGYTQKQVAQRLGIDFTTVSKYENNRSEPDNDTLMRLADLYGVSVSYLLGTSEMADDQLSQSMRILFEAAQKLTDRQRESLARFLQDMAASDSTTKSVPLPEFVREQEDRPSEQDEEIDVEQLAAHMEGVYGISSPEFRREIAEVIKRNRKKYIREKERQSNEDSDI
ncbi:MAG: helix-turn-helix transcriptional regulator [Alicyclobacillus sp.]|nr:helix-turn-helix transcriptional regulator [Alicyclobacillus sp.]